MKKVAFHTLGCKVNQVETEQMKEDFISRGYSVVSFNEIADVYVVNTCTVTHISDRKSRAMLRRAVRNNPDALVVAAGCVAQVDAEQLAAITGVELVVGNKDKDKIAEMVDEYLISQEFNEKIRVDAIRPEDKLKPIMYSQMHERTRAFVKIQDGCQSFCSFCIVPLARGPVRSKLPGDVIDEITRLVSIGYREIVLTGIHTGFYGIDLNEWDLSRLLKAIFDSIKGDYRIRLSSIEPLELTDELINLIVDNKKICRHFHIPLQSGSDRILKSMGRRYDRDYYQNLVKKIAARIPGAAFTADIMVGYPTEEDCDFLDSYDIINELPIYDLHVFKYSPRPGTRAANLIPRVAEETKQSRSITLIQLADEKRLDFINRLKGDVLSVLVERKREDGTYTGMSDNYIELAFSSQKDLRGEFADVMLQGAELGFAQGQLCSS